MEIFTIGFTTRTAEDFFDTLNSVGVTRLVDVRLNNTSQLAGFTKRDDLRYFLARLCGAAYVHEPLLTPTRELFDDYKRRRGTWSTYERAFLELMAERRIEERVGEDLLNGVPVLLCSERSPDHCHRRLVGEYLREHWGGIELVHL